MRTSTPTGTPSRALPPHVPPARAPPSTRGRQPASHSVGESLDHSTSRRREAHERRRGAQGCFSDSLGSATAYQCVRDPVCAVGGRPLTEVTRAMPGDDIVGAPQWSMTFGITIQAPPAAIWPWLAQLGLSARWPVQLRLARSPVRDPRSPQRRRGAPALPTPGSGRRDSDRGGTKLAGGRGRAEPLAGARAGRARQARLLGLRAVSDRRRRDAAGDPCAAGAGQRRRRPAAPSHPRSS